MTQNTRPPSNTLLWIICGLLTLAGIGISLHALFNFDRANVIVEWTTASELNTVGFNLLRGETPVGPFAQINEALIPANSDSLTGNSYSYEDPGLVAGNTYFYLLEEVENSGSANQHGPIVVVAKSPAKIEALIGGLLILGALVYTILLFRDRKPQQPEIL